MAALRRASGSRAKMPTVREPVGGTRDRIVQAALELFSAKGFEGTGISEIAGRVGIAKSVIYHHFPSKEAMLEEISRSTIGAAIELKRDLAGRLAEALGESRDLTGVVEALVSFVLSHRAAIAVLLRESLRGGPRPPLFVFWESNLKAGADIARDLGFDLAAEPSQEVLFEAFFMLVLPIVGFAVLGDSWAQRFGLDPRRLRMTFEKVFRINLEELWFDRYFRARTGGAKGGTARR